MTALPTTKFILLLIGILCVLGIFHQSPCYQIHSCHIFAFWSPRRSAFQPPLAASTISCLFSLIFDFWLIFSNHAFQCAFHHSKINLCCNAAVISPMCLYFQPPQPPQADITGHRLFLFIFTFWHILTYYYHWHSFKLQKVTQYQERFRKRLNSLYNAQFQHFISKKPPTMTNSWKMTGVLEDALLKHPEPTAEVEEQDFSPRNE